MEALREGKGMLEKDQMEILHNIEHILIYNYDVKGGRRTDSVLLGNSVTVMLMEVDKGVHKK